jgi:RHS repeat-associated protein
LKPHAVTNANGTAYGYDACGNMTARGGQTLAYDGQNQLIQVSTTNDSVTFGYDDDGERLWRKGTNGYSIWIGGIYEINSGKVLCHVMAGGKLIATFEPLCGGPWAGLIGEKRWYLASAGMDRVLGWPFREGRASLTVWLGMFTGILGMCLISRRRQGIEAGVIRRAWRPGSLWRQAVAFACMAAVLMTGTPNAEATTYNPVFYYYHTDSLGSSNVLTDRSGNVVQHYEYATFGQTSFTDNNSAFPVSNRYTGQIADDETGLYYYGGRYYDPGLGRFIQPDPDVPDPTDSQSLNRYSYCRNNPLNATDPTGYDDEGGDGSGWGFFDGWDGGFNFGDQFGGGFDFGSTPPSGLATGTLFNGGVEGFLGQNSWAFQEANSTPDWMPNPQISMTPSYDLIASVSSDGETPNATSPATASLGQAPEAAAATLSAEAPTSTQSGGAWLPEIAKGAALVSMLPPPVGPIAGIVDVVGEAAQHHWAAAGVAAVTTALALGGLGFLTGFGKAAAETTAMRNVVQFEGMEVRAVRDLSHVEQGTLEAMQQHGFAPTTVSGDSTVLHHLGQNPAGPLVEMPAANHSIWNSVQHPLGSTAGAGLTDAERAAYNAWRTDYWKWRATQELNTRRVLGQ